LGIDGPDGVGKSTFCKVLCDEIRSRGRAARVVRATSFEESDRAKIVGDLFSRATYLRQDSVAHNRFFLVATKFNFVDLIVPKSSHEIVILDSSELRLIAYLMSRKMAIDALVETISWFKSGRLTGGWIPEKRVFLCADPTDLYLNLTSRNKIDYGDPTSIRSAADRINCYEATFEIASEVVGGSSSIRINNPRCSNPKEALLGFVDMLIERS
jgi:thymidylate kinase